MDESGISEGEEVCAEEVCAEEVKDDIVMTVAEVDELPNQETMAEEITKYQITSMTQPNKTQDSLVQAIDKIPPGLQAQVEYTTKAMVEEIQKATIKRQQFIKEKELTEEILRAKEIILEAEMKLALSRLNGQCDLSFGHNICASGGSENRVNVYSNASAPPQTSLESLDLLNISTNNIPISISPTSGAVGLDQLAILESVKITQVSCSGVNEAYHVLAPDGSEVLRADITLGWIVQAFARRRPGRNGKLFDSQNEEVVTFHPLKPRKMTVQVGREGKEKPCFLKLKSTFLKLVVSVKDMFGNVLLKIKYHKAKGHSELFAIETVNKLRIGYIQKYLYDTVFEKFGSTYIQFPRDLDLTCKAAIIICSFLIMSKAQAQRCEHRMQLMLLATLQPWQDIKDI